MTWFSVLVLTYYIDGDNYEPMVSRIIYPSYNDCSNAMTAIYENHLYAHYRDSMAQCLQTDKVSSVNLRPKYRPKNLNKGKQNG